MSSTDKQTYFITGANRGIGLGLLKAYLLRPNTTVIAGVRSPNSDSSMAIHWLPRAESSSSIVVKIDTTSPIDAAAIMKELDIMHHITKLDVVIANAGIMKSFGLLTDVTPDMLLEHVNVNVVGTLLLYQATLPLLLESSSPKFVHIGSQMGSIARMEDLPGRVGAYGASKAMVHFLVRKMHHENPGLCAFTVDPGFVQTDMGKFGADFFGMADAPVKLDDCVAFITTTIDGATKEKTSGHFPSIEGGDYMW